MSDTSSYDDHPSHGATEDYDDGPIALPFASILQMLSRGEVHDDLTERFRELLAECRALQLKGTFTLKLVVKPKGEMLTIEPSAKFDMPQPEHDASLFYFDRHANPSREDPQQPKLPMQAVPAPGRRAHQPPAPREVRVAPGRTNTE